VEVDAVSLQPAVTRLHSAPIVTREFFSLKATYSLLLRPLIKSIFVSRPLARLILGDILKPPPKGPGLGVAPRSYLPSGRVGMEMVLQRPPDRWLTPDWKKPYKGIVFICHIRRYTPWGMRISSSKSWMEE
jgi:hypothetical protein